MIVEEPTGGIAIRGYNKTLTCVARSEFKVMISWLKDNQSVAANKVRATLFMVMKFLSKFNIFFNIVFEEIRLSCSVEKFMKINLKQSFLPTFLTCTH